MRSPLSHLRTLYPPPTYEFEPGFAEEDPLWDANERESVPHRVARATQVLDVVFREDATCEWLLPTFARDHTLTLRVVQMSP